MKTLHAFACCALAAALLAGCGSKPFCERQKDTLNALDTKVADCPDMKEGLRSYRPADGKCEAMYESQCTASDKTVLDDMVACLEELPKCEAATQMSTWAPKAIACQTKANSLSAACIGITQP